MLLILVYCSWCCVICHASLVQPWFLLLQVCSAVNESYWQCIEATTPPAQIAAYAQCGGVNCVPVLGNAANAITCSNAAWSNAECSDSSTSCQRIDDYMWQCLPTSSSAEASPEASPEAEASPAVTTTQCYTDKHKSDINPGNVKANVKAVSSSPVPEEATPAQDSGDDSDSEQESSLAVLILPDGDVDLVDDSEDDSGDMGDLDLDILTFAFNMECLQVSSMFWSALLFFDHLAIFTHTSSAHVIQGLFWVGVCVPVGCLQSDDMDDMYLALSRSM